MDRNEGVLEHRSADADPNTNGTGCFSILAKIAVISINNAAAMFAMFIIDYHLHH